MEIKNFNVRLLDDKSVLVSGNVNDKNFEFSLPVERHGNMSVIQILELASDSIYRMIIL